MRTSILFGAKNFEFFLKFTVCPHGQGGWASADIFRTIGEDSILRDLVRTSFMDDLLGYFKMTTLLALNLKKLSFLKCFKCFQFKIFLKWLATKANGDESGGAVIAAQKSPVPYRNCKHQRQMSRLGISTMYRLFLIT